MANHAKGFFLSVWARWKAELSAFVQTRKELWAVGEYRTAFWISLVPFAAVPLHAVFGKDAVFFEVLLLISAMLLSGVWLAVAGVVAAGGALLDNVPFLSDASSAVDALDGLGFERIERLSGVLEKKKRLEERIDGFLR